MSTRTWPLLCALSFAVGAVAALILRTDPRVERGGHLHRDERKYEVPELADPALGLAMVRLTRAVLDGDRPDPGALDLHPGRRVIACAYGLGRRALCGAGDADTLGAAVVAAARDLARHDRDWARAALKLDLVVAEEPVRWPARGFDHGIGVHGLWVQRGGEVSWLTPSELLEIPVWVVDDDGEGAVDEGRLRASLTQRNPAIGELPARFPFRRIRTTSWVERVPVGGGVVRTYRTHRFDPPPADPEVLLDRAVLAADHLAAITGDDGRIRYLYDPALDQERPGYNLLRHAGSGWALVQAWARTGHDPWLAAAGAAIDELLAHTVVQERHGPFGGGETRWVRETDRIKLGGAGLGLLLLAEYIAATGDDRYLDEARQLARYLVSAQAESGEFSSFAPIAPEDPPIGAVSAYYPGEAIVGLARLYTVDRDPLWLDTAERGARWLVEVRDAGKGPRELANDHWLMIGLARLYAETGDPLWVEHSLALAEAVALQHRRHRHHARYHRDYRGGYYQPPRSTPAATRAEGLVAVLDTCRLAERTCPQVWDVLESTVRHLLQSQYTAGTSWWLRAPERAFGAFHGGPSDVTIRNDYVQHNLSAVLGLERLLRAEGGERLPGGPDWTSADQAAFAGLPAHRLAAALAPARSIRGTHRWDLDPVDISGAPVVRGRRPVPAPVGARPQESP